MSDRLTSISLPGLFGSGLAEYGRKSPGEMVAAVRKYAAAQHALYGAILAAEDADFRIETYVGVLVQRNSEVLQDGRSKAEREARAAT